MSGLRVLKTSLLCSLQDSGRVGFSDIGVCQSGVVDEFSFYHLNNILNNQKDTNALEINLGGASFEVIKDTNIAFTGAKTDITINSKPIKMWKSIEVKNGDKIKIGFAKNGAVIYLGVKGGFIGKKVLGSYSVSIKEQIGINPIKTGDFLPFKSTKSHESRSLKSKFIPYFQDEIILHVMASYQHDRFDKNELEKFFSSIYQVTSQSNRMGFRLTGYALKNVQKGLISEGICFGAIQISSDGTPIILLKERQSIGGYPKIGTILPSDCFILSQSTIGTKIRFEKISFENATQKMREFYNQFNLNPNCKIS